MSSSRRWIGVAFSLAHYYWGGEKKGKDGTSARGLSFFFSFSGGVDLRYFPLLVEHFP